MSAILRPVPTLLWASLGILGFAGASFFFALAESALFALSKWQARQLADQTPGPGVAVLALLDRPQDLLATLALGNSFANAGVIALALWTFVHQSWPTGVVVGATVALFVFVLVGCEVIPKMLAVRAPEEWSLRVAKPMALLLDLTPPVHRLARAWNRLILRVLMPRSAKPPSGISDDEYRELMELAVQQGTIAQSEKEIILQILRLDQRTARDVMKPLSQMVSISDDLPVEEMIEVARRHQHRRLPIHDESPDTIVGILNSRALLLDPQIDLAEAIEFPSFVPASMNLLQLLKSLQRQKRGLAIVLDEYGGTAGLVTTEDILEEMVGELRDEGEAQGFVMERLGPGRWRVNATMRIEDFRREHRDLGEWPEVETLGGLVVHHWGVVPAEGATCVVRDLKFTVTAGDERRVRELLVEAVEKRARQ
jgi:CBS domain containing-hemolysin-like protein